MVRYVSTIVSSSTMSARIIVIAYMLLYAVLERNKLAGANVFLDILEVI